MPLAFTACRTNQERFRRHELTGQLSSSADVAAHYDRWLQSLSASLDGFRRNEEVSAGQGCAWQVAF